MELTVVTVPGCPNGPVLEERLARALDGGPRATVRRQEVRTEDEAERWGMHGSPTLLIDGRDPFATPDLPVGLACRLYPSEAGGRREGAPSVEAIRAALNGA
ncbi:thioredoxin family protein [Actinomadura harenae]|uniref:Thioredoxin family protein n=1 Tax=Actinomadura harenae TaxID=2483351 RepID=A0A3M2L7Z8_9ACTN|nr:thioredoxin family protein [Actinomadura harenae]RMI33116.1 thioredoxin family protein [Actinomadura harenae]